MSAAELARPAMIFAPHPDDETLGCGGLIALKRLEAVPVDVIFLMDGHTSHRRFMNAQELVAQRRKEAIAACEILGVATDAVTFLGFPDGEIAEHRGAAVTAVEELLSARGDRQIYLPYLGDTNPDHRETRRIVREAAFCLSHQVTIYEYPVWFWVNWPWVQPPFASLRSVARLLTRGATAVWRRNRDLVEFVDINSVLKVKESALRRHETQMQRPTGKPEWPVLEDVGNGDWLRCFFTGREYFHRYRLPEGGTGDSSL